MKTQAEFQREAMEAHKAHLQRQSDAIACLRAAHDELYEALDALVLAYEVVAPEEGTMGARAISAARAALGRALIPLTRQGSGQQL